MGEVIQISSHPKFKPSYRNLVKSTLDDEDYQDVMNAIEDVDFYSTLDEDLQEIVDWYFKYGT